MSRRTVTRVSRLAADDRPRDCDAGTAGRQDDIRRQRDQFRREFANVIGIACAPAVVDLHIPADGPAQLLQPLMESREARLCFRIIGGEVHEHADAPRPLALLRARRERPSGRAAPRAPFASDRLGLHDVFTSTACKFLPPVSAV